MEYKKKILKVCMKKGFLLDKEMLDYLTKFEEFFSVKMIESLSSVKINEKLLNKKVFLENRIILRDFFKNTNELIQFDSFFNGLIENFENNLEKPIKIKKNPLKILSSSIITPKKIEVFDFVKHFRNRYEQIKSFLEEKGLENLKSLRRISDERETQHVIVMILDKKVTKNKNLLFEVEDLTGRSRILVNLNRNDLYDKCKDILPDEVVAFNVSGKKELLFANDVIFPDMYLVEKRKSSEDINIVFTSDVHVGSKMFLKDNFMRFIKWINGEEGSEEQKEIARKIKYLFLVGDNVDGVGVFPEQDKLLEIKDLRGQYKKLAEYLRLIRKDINIIISPGQHDAVWVGEPQLAIEESWAEDLYKLENVTLVTNPCMLEIEEGFKILMYHGASFHGIVSNVMHIRMNHGHNNPTIILKELLRKRHLSPIHGECDYIPMENKDPMVIEIAPDIIATGDLHKPEVSTYNNILLIASSCWQSKTPFEEKVGNNPDPAKVPVFNIKTREVKILDFSSEGDLKEEKRNEN